MHVFDVHLHFFGREFYQHHAAMVDGTDPDATLQRICDGGIEVPDPDTRAHALRWTREMDRHRVDRAVLFASVPDELIVVGETASASRGRFVPFAAINPLVPVTLSALRGLLPTFGFRGVLLFPAMHGYSIQSPEVSAVLELAKAQSMLVFVHCGQLRVRVRELVGLDPDFPAENSRPRDVAAVARAHPDVAFILPHFGAGYLEETLDLAAAYRNIYVDTAGSQGWLAKHTPALSLADVFRETRDAAGGEHILYGSDSGVFPRGYRGDLLLAQIDAMIAAGFSSTERAAVLGGNLERLLAR